MMDKKKIKTEQMTADRELKKAINRRIAAGNEAAVVALQELINWVPWVGFPKNVEPFYCEVQLIKDDGRKDSVDDYREQQHLNEKIPFCCESYTYELWGKEDARTFLSLLGQMARALGLDGVHVLREDKT